MRGFLRGICIFLIAFLGIQVGVLGVIAWAVYIIRPLLKWLGL